VLMSTRLLARAERATAKERARSMPRLARASATLAGVVEALLAAAEAGEALSIPELWDRLAVSRPRSPWRRRRCGS
jgi:hypothetical protein